MSTVYVMRHGDTVSRANTDAERPLSERGIAEAESMVDTLLAEPPGLIWVSPYLRAQQTKDAVVAGLTQHGCNPLVETVEGITPDDHPMAVLALLSRYQESADQAQGPLLLVSHNPLVSLLLSVLTEGHAQPSIGMATASIACLQGDVFASGSMILEWYKTPGI